MEIMGWDYGCFIVVDFRGEGQVFRWKLRSDGLVVWLTKDIVTGYDDPMEFQFFVAEPAGLKMIPVQWVKRRQFELAIGGFLQ